MNDDLLGDDLKEGPRARRKSKRDAWIDLRDEMGDDPEGDA